MQAIRLLYAKNVISRKHTVPQQELVFAILVDNRAYDKRVEVHWTDEDGGRHVSPAWYGYAAGHNQEIWLATVAASQSEDTVLPGNVRFGLHYHVLGQSFVDDNQGQLYRVDADSGVMLAGGFQMAHIDYRPILQNGEKYLPISIAVDRSLRPKRVVVRWTADKWQSFQETSCYRRKNYWDKALLSNARNPNQYGYEVWHGRVRIDNAYRVEYAIGCQTGTEILWDNNFGQNYIAHRPRLKIMTLNLHCYQEASQDAKFSQIARAIDDLDVDVVCLQEVGEKWNDGRGDWDSNAARIIQARLRRPYHLYTEWSHVGFDRFGEGVAVLSKYPFLKQEARYVSASDDIYTIHARKVVMAQVRVPYVGVVNVFSAHLSWWEDGFATQFENLRHWADQTHDRNVVATLLCGDFNVKAGSDGYMQVVNSREYEDQFLKARAPHVFTQVFEQPAPQPPDYLRDDHRIDYIFLKKDSQLRPVAARILFTDEDYGRVSDHPGYYAEFEPFE